MTEGAGISYPINFAVSYAVDYATANSDVSEPAGYDGFYTSDLELFCTSDNKVFLVVEA